MVLKTRMNWFGQAVTSLLGIGLIFSVFIFSVNPAQTADLLKDCTKISVGFKPLIDMQATDYYPNADHPNKVNGGLYGDGHNIPPESHWQRAKAANAAILPRAADGTPAADGKIGLIALGMSNTSSEFYTFQTAHSEISLESPCCDGGEWRPAGHDRLLVGLSRCIP
jgi:hypothetical protein